MTLAWSPAVKYKNAPSGLNCMHLMRGTKKREIIGETYSQRIWGPVPVLSEGVSNIHFQIVDDNLGSVALVAILVEFEPGDFITLVTENGTVNSALFTRRQLAWLLLASNINNVDLSSQDELCTFTKTVTKHTFCFVCHASGSCGSLVVYTIWAVETSKSSVPPNGSTGECFTKEL